MKIFLSDKQLAERWNVTRQTIWKYARADPNFPKPIKLGPGTTRWNGDEVEAFEKAKAEAAA